MIRGLEAHEPTLGAEAWVADSAWVIGDVSLGEQVSVWFGAVVRGDVEKISIGARSNIQDLCVVHADPGYPTVIGADVTVGHKATLHGCTIGEGALIGIGAIILNGAVIGAQSIVAAGALIPEGKSFPPRSLILGSPAKVVRELSDEELAQLRDSAAHYVANAQRYAQI